MHVRFLLSFLFLVSVLTTIEGTGGNDCECDIKCKIKKLWKYKKRQPNIVFIMVDDVGWNDFGLHGSSQIPTPNIDALAYNGQSLNRFYTLHICTPSRTAVLTGKDPFTLGMAGIPLRPSELRPIPSNVTFLPALLKTQGYYTYLVGKWHMGYYNNSATPTGRGFDHFLGYYNGFISYFTYEIEQSGHVGFDLHRDNYPECQGRGKYATDLFTDEAIKIIEKQKKCDKPFFLMLNHLAAHTGINGTGLETKNDTEANETFGYIKEPKRRLYAAIMKELDTNIGKLMKALAKAKLLKNTIVVLISDNGGQTTDPFFGYANYASNWPLRGMKFSLSEGGVRNFAAIYYYELCRKKYVNKDLMHITDWYPTLYAAAGGDVKSLNDIDGVNQWQMFTKCKRIERKPIVVNIDEVQKYEAIISSNGTWKLTNGTCRLGDYDNYTGDPGRGLNDPPYDFQAVLNSDVNQAILSIDSSYPLTEAIMKRMRAEVEIIEGKKGIRNNTCRDICLYNLDEDPTEKNDVKGEHPEILEYLLNQLSQERKRLKKSLNSEPDPKGFPENCSGQWFPWLEPRENLPQCYLQCARKQ